MVQESVVFWPPGGTYCPGYRCKLLDSHSCRGHGIAGMKGLAVTHFSAQFSSRPSTAEQLYKVAENSTRNHLSAFGVY